MDDAQCVPAPQATVWAALNDPEPSCASAFRATSGAHDVGDRNGRLGRGPGLPGQGEVRPTLLHYVVDTRIGGKLAQLGGRLIDSTAKKLAGEFFRAFAAATAGTHAPAEVLPRDGGASSGRRSGAAGAGCAA